MPTPQFSAPDINSFEGLRDYVIKTQRDLQYLLTNLDDLNINRLDARVIVAESITADKIAAKSITADQIAANTITANEIAANSITADRMNVSQLSAISADLGHITAGLIEAVQIFGSYIATSQSSFPKVEFSSTDNLIKAMSDANNYVALSPSEGLAPAYTIYASSAIKALIQYVTGRFLLASVGGEDTEISSGKDLYLHAGIGGFVRFASWTEVFSTLDGQTLQAALNAKQDSISGATGSFDTVDNKTVIVTNGIVTSIL